MEKFNSKKHAKYAKELPFSYLTLPLYLDWSGYIFERNGEQLIVTQDPMAAHDFPALFVPKKKKNWEYLSVSCASEEEIEKIEKAGIPIKHKNPIGSEYFYETASLLEPKKKIRQRINQFKKLYQYELSNKATKKEITDFYKKWKAQKKSWGEFFEESEKYFWFCLDNLSKIKQVYVKVNGQIVGLAWGAIHPSGNWVGLHLKVLYKYKGVSRFLHQERAKLFAEHELFTIGTGAHDPGITQFKEELGPKFQKEYFYVFTGLKK